MKKTSLIHYTFEDANGSAETFNGSDFRKKIAKEKVIGISAIELVGEETFLTAPVLEGYKKPYDWDVTDDIGTEHYIYYEEE